jgi:hypothetical protein
VLGSRFVASGPRLDGHRSIRERTALPNAFAFSTIGYPAEAPKLQVSQFSLNLGPEPSVDANIVQDVIET